MRVIAARNVADAWAQAIAVVREPAHMQREESRVGAVYVAPEPVTTVYKRPQERVLLDPVRDCNPFFHFFEALWMLAGRDDATWLDQFVSDYSARFAEPDGTGRQHGAYGARWRRHFGREGFEAAHGGMDEDYQPGDPDKPLDQLNEVVRLLRENNADRQAVLQMWDPPADLGVPGLRDRPCNVSACLRVRAGIGLYEAQPAPMRAAERHDSTKVLDLTVLCRSNDIVWGCYGANAVHMSVLQEYLAARIGVGVGRYYQVSNNWHVYEATLDKMNVESASACAVRPYPGFLPLVDDPDSFDDNLRFFMSWTEKSNEPEDGPSEWPYYRNRVFVDTALRMYAANKYRQRGDLAEAVRCAERIRAPDWRGACVEWLQRRRARRAGRAA